MEILVGLTSTRKEKIPYFLEEIRNLDIQKIALFPTGLNSPEREALYSELENSPITQIPHVHLRSDMTEAELEYLTQRFQTEVFNIHSLRSIHPYYPDSDRFLQNIFIENSGVIPMENELLTFGGLCIDFSHWENGVLKNDFDYKDFIKIVKRHKIGCCHVSAIRKTPESPWGGFDDHTYHSLSDFDYLEKYREFLPPWVSLELENLPSEQLLVKEMLEKRLEFSCESC